LNEQDPTRPRDYPRAFQHAVARIGSGGGAARAPAKHLAAGAVDYVCLLSESGDRFPDTGHIRQGQDCDSDSRQFGPAKDKEHWAALAGQQELLMLRELGFDGCAGGQMQSGGEMQQGQQNALSAQDIEEEANVHFRRIYTAEIQIEAVVQMLKNFKASADQREQEVFACMIHNLFDEYRFFPRYPERELLITGKLFGSLIQHQLVSSITLGIALRYVLEALRKPLRSNMFKFGMCALEQFKQRLVEWPQYCHHILQITHLRQSHAELMDDIQAACNRGRG
jgi:hypothetical protein